MYNYIKGIVTEIKNDSIVLDNSGIGYLVFTARPLDYVVSEYYVVYIYYYHKEDGISLFGFQSEQERNIFNKMLKVRGVGPKSAINVLSGGDINSFISAIESGDLKYLKKLPGVGDKMAIQLVAELKGSFKLLNEMVKKENTAYLSTAYDALMNLGFSKKEVDEALFTLRGESLTSEEYVRKALIYFNARRR